MKLILAMWVLAVAVDGAAAMILAWEFARKKRWKNVDSRYSFILFFTMFASRVIRLFSFIGLSQRIPDQYAVRSLVSMSVEAAGLWAFYLYVIGWFDGTLQIRVAVFVVRIAKCLVRIIKKRPKQNE